MKTNKEPLWKNVAPGIYRHRDNGLLYERIQTNGKATWLATGVKTIGDAKQIRNARLTKRTQQAEGIAPPAPAEFQTVGKVIDFYLENDCPDRDRQERDGKALKQDKSRSNILSQWWKRILVTDIRVALLDEYADWRKKQTFNGKKTKGRAVDLELNTLRNALYWALRREKIHAMPNLGKWPIYANGEKKHCYLFRPYGGDELHKIAEAMFTARGHRSESAGFLYLFLAMTGSRIGEALAMRHDAKPGKCGFIEDWKFLHTEREKGGVNPWIQIHPALESLLRELAKWREKRHPESPWFFPSSVKPTKPLTEGALGRILQGVTERLGIDHRTPHGARAYYVTLRRSQRISDAVIAAEIGHTTGGSTLQEAYGGVPQNWYIAGHPELTWMPSEGKPAWEAITYMADEETPSNIVSLSEVAA